MSFSIKFLFGNREYALKEIFHERPDYKGHLWWVKKITIMCSKSLCMIDLHFWSSADGQQIGLTLSQWQFDWLIPRVPQFAYEVQTKQTQYRVCFDSGDCNKTRLSEVGGWRTSGLLHAKSAVVFSACVTDLHIMSSFWHIPSQLVAWIGWVRKPTLWVHNMPMLSNFSAFIGFAQVSTAYI